MPRFFDDYSNTYLTHDSSAGRKQQRRGWKFRENFKLYYDKHVPGWRKGPMGLASAQQAFVRARGADDPAVPPLPEGWKEETDGVTGIPYYVHADTKKRSWVRPGFIPPPPGGGGGPPPGFRGGPPPGFRGGPPPQMHGRFPPQQGGPPPPMMQQQQPPPHLQQQQQMPPQQGGPPPPPHMGFPPPPLGGGLPPPPMGRLPPPPHTGGPPPPMGRPYP